MTACIRFDGFDPMEFELDSEALAAMLEVFLAEAEEGLTEMEGALLRLEAAPEDPEAVATLFRIVHSLKGNAGLFEFVAVGELSHVLENTLDDVRCERLPVTQELVSLLLESTDTLRQAFEDSVAGRRQLIPAEEELTRRLRRLRDENQPVCAVPEESTLVPGASPPSVGSAQVRRLKTLRVDLDKLDRLLNLSAEVAIARGWVTQMLADPAVARETVLEAQRDSERLHLDLQELVMKLRMVPVGPTFRQLLRTVRDVASSHGKEARLVVEGDEVEVDLTVIEHLKDPLVHMIRNSIDHGIEDPETRRRAGKAPTGLLELHSYYDSGSIVIELKDDGAGLDSPSILQRARERGLIADGATPTDQQIFDFIFQPGFSTADEVTSLSGRGVGMDVVRRNIEALHGALRVASAQGLGTKITIRLPLTLAVIEGLQVGVGDDIYIIPMEAVVESLELPAEVREERLRSGVFFSREESLPYIRLREIFGTGHGEGRRENIVVARHPHGLAGLVVDRLMGECQTVIKPLARALRGLPGVSGSAILPSGRVAFILDIPGLLRQEIALERQVRLAPSASSAAVRPVHA